MKSLIRLTLLAVFPILFFALVALAQNVKISAGYAGSEFKFDPDEVAEYLNGFWVDVDGKIVSKGNFRIGGVFNLKRTLNVTQLDPMTYPILPAMASMPMFDIVQRDTNTYSFGPRLSYRAGPVEPFATALFGFKSATDVSTRKFVRRYQIGLDIPFHKESRFFIRPFFLEYEFVQGFAGPSIHSYGAGAGFRF